MSQCYTWRQIARLFYFYPPLPVFSKILLTIMRKNDNSLVIRILFFFYITSKTKKETKLRGL
jgi:hypothetical protein